jgi:hypothetical protein
MNELTATQDLSSYLTVVDRICGLDWACIDRADLRLTAWAYYYFSVQFRVNLEIAHRLHPWDPLLSRLVREECDTDNLSPWPGVAEPGERLNHDEFMRRLLTLEPIGAAAQADLEAIGHEYLRKIRAEDDDVRASSIATYEDGGLERVFRAILRNQCWDTPLLAGFHHFLMKHISFDSNPNQGHGALARHLAPDHRVRRLWEDFYLLFVAPVPRLLGPA